MESRKKILEQDARIQNLEVMVYKKGTMCDNSIDDKGSCSVKLQPMIEDGMKNDDDDLQILCQADVLQGKPVALTLESSTNIVAHGTIVCGNESNKMLHGVPFPNNCMRVSIDEAVEKSAPLPYPIPSEFEVIGDAVGTHVAWPKHLIVNQDEKPRRKKLEQPKKKLTLSTSAPRALHMLYCYSKRALDDGRYISVSFDYDVFDDDYELVLHLEDIIPLYHLEPLSGNCVIAYIWYLYKKLLKDNKKEKFRFVNPHKIPYMATSAHDKKGTFERLNQRASHLAGRLSGASVDQLVLVPCNIGFHWILTVIDPYNEVIYLLDSLRHRIHDEDWKYIVEMSPGGIYGKKIVSKFCMQLMC
ncbi:uncharacterized protein LOC121996847 isoform X1 [Zingiber officinale]|uniref:uncharacterized protein LOC121996847 isoform X1 n=1 Tax=Zingiber officinale TaxID=94328 RepID=UPI001C4C3C14|nr:uncharacterized protein LOC121996847 isoform X1 [Zingiber officinale]XP_042406913.1 uncharacterized protein LOC121996847 isoform X1 [Zingiber officinale]